MVEILKSFMISQGNWNGPDFDDVGFLRQVPEVGCYLNWD